MKQRKTRNLLAAALNLLTAVLVMLSILWFFTPEGKAAGEGNMQTGGTNCFIFFTNDSNILAALTALLAIPFEIRAAVRGENGLPAWLLVLRLVSTAAVTLTMTVVVLFLGPLQGYAKMFSGVCLPLHLLCPLLAIVTFCFLERGCRISRKHLLLAVLPTLLYGTVYLINVIFLQSWDDFYGFNLGGFWYISYAVLPAVTCVLALGLRALHNRFDRT